MTQASTHSPCPDLPANDIAQLDALTLMAQIQKRQLSCVDVMQAYLDRIAACNPAHLALVNLQDTGRLLEQAKQQDEAGLPQDGPARLLHGFPQAPKDLLPVTGLPTTMGSQLFAQHLAETEAPTFTHMREQGALFIGRTNTPEFGLGCHTYNTLHGTTRNAFDLSTSAGGSSGGAAVAVALHMLPFADGSDMMGSLRTPAAFNGIYGLRPTPGLVPTGPENPLVKPSLAVAGPMARNLPDLALLLACMAGFSDQLPFEPRPEPHAFLVPLEADLKGRRIAWAGDLAGRLPMTKGLLDDTEAALPLFETLGCHVDPHVPAFDYDALWQAWIDLRSVLFYQAQKPWLEQPELFRQVKPEAQWEYERGRNMPEANIQRGLEAHRQWQACLVETFKQYDYLLMPTVQTPPFKAEWSWPATIGEQAMDTYHRWMEIVLPASFGGLPTLAVPRHRLAANQGNGLQIMAAPGADLAVMQLGHAYDQLISG